MPGHEQPCRDEQDLNDLLVDGVQRIGQYPLKNNPPLLDRRDDAGKAGVGQHHACGGLGDIRRRGHRNPDLGLAKRWRIIGAVAAHSDRVTGVLIGLDQIELIFGQDAGEDRVVLEANAIREAAWRTERAVKTDGTRDREAPSRARRPRPSPL